MNTAENKITLAIALEMLRSNTLTSSHFIVYEEEDKIEATDAIKMGYLGIDVPEDRITYNDEEVQDDEFEGDWEEIKSDLEDYYRKVNVNLNLNYDTISWITKTTNCENLEEAIGTLLTSLHEKSLSNDKTKKDVKKGWITRLNKTAKITTLSHKNSVAKKRVNSKVKK